jgi:hypothetical protein
MLVSSVRQSKARRGGTIVNVLTAVVFFGLIGAGLWWIMKTAGQAGQQYSEAMIETTDKATTLACQANLRTIGQNLQMYAISNNEFPASQEELVRWGGSTRLFRCPDPNGGTYVYVPGLGGGAPPASVVVYEPNAVHDGRCNALLLNGQIATLTPERLRQALEATLAARR